jgi:hypothetical protein
LTVNMLRSEPSSATKIFFCFFVAIFRPHPSKRV